MAAHFTFTPTPASIPPSNVVYRLKDSPNASVNSHPLNPLDFILRAAQIYPDKVALVHPNVEYPVQYTFAVWAQRIQNLAYALIRAGVKPGDRVAVIAPNSPLIADAHHGVIAARAVLTPINTRLKPSEVAYILEHSGSSIILVDYEYTHLIPPGTRVPVIVSKDTGRADDPYETLLAEGRRFSEEKSWGGLVAEPDENAGAVLCYTSGTTGRPKGVITTLRGEYVELSLLLLTEVASTGLGSYLAAIANAFECQILPMFHAAGWTFPWSNVFAFAKQARFSLKLFSYSFLNVTTEDHAQDRKLHADMEPLPPFRRDTLLRSTYSPTRRLPQNVTAVIAGAAPTAHLIAELENIGFKPVHVYGLTSVTYGPFTRNYDQPHWENLSLEERARLMARQGQAFATALGVRVVLPPADDDKNPVLRDVPRDGKTVGEIVTRGNIVMKEYFRDPEATRKAFHGGYFRSGDLAVMHPDGTIAVVDRSKDIIISGGENASSLAIELELASHPHVLEVCAVARPHPKWGERPMAFVILHPQHANKWAGRHHEFAKDLKEHARTRLPGFACPEWVEVVPELPKTSTGKILKTELRKIVVKL
ncbi:hypothetical protein D9756_003900 [Leucocoprinus leucothites]|uniref:Acetyl-CoA synthetase-like protein n=1 Tax=Leucocoprinus leucothites TaxID=201217 RepID=A0A8H5DA08_9AGAR|nr:hypothetical protein D9756_003900 [Leucoagaricus leucothites]